MGGILWMAHLMNQMPTFYHDLEGNIVDGAFDESNAYVLSMSRFSLGQKNTNYVGIFLVLPRGKSHSSLRVLLEGFPPL